MGFDINFLTSKIPSEQLLMSYIQWFWHHKFLWSTDLDFDNWSKTSKFGLIGCSQLEYLDVDKPIEFWRFDQK